MKAFQILLFLVIIILIGYMAALYWGKSVQEATVPIEVVDELTPEPAEEELSPGSYLVFQSVEVSDPGTQDWANDDTETYTFYRLALGEATYRSNPSVDDLILFATIEHGPAFSGSLTSYIFGQDILMHRYESTRTFDRESGQPSEGEEQDGILSLQGKVFDVRAESWGQLRSDNGLYEVVWEYPYDGEGPDVTVTNTESDEFVAQVSFSTIREEADARWEFEPFLIDDAGEYLYVHEVCGCEATLSGTWQVEIATGEVTRLDTLVDLDSWFLSSLDVNGRGLLAISTEREPSNEEPGDNLLPPIIVRILDLESLDVGELLVDEERAWGEPWLDSSGNDRFIIRGRDSEEGRLYLVDFADTEITNEQYLTDGRVLDWVGDWLVVSNTQDSTLKLVNVESKEEVSLEISGERVEYVGSIELN